MVDRPKTFEEWFDLMPNAMLLDKPKKHMQSMYTDILLLNNERKRKAKALRKANEDYMKKIDAFSTYAKELKHDELSE